MDGKRPQSRKTYVTDNSKGVHRRGSGLGTGPVGSGSGGGSSQGGGRGAGGSGGSMTRGKSPILTIIIALIALLGGGGGILGSGALSGGGSSFGGNYSMSQSAYPGISQGSAASGWSSASNVQQLDRTVAEGSRAKRTQILGNGRDTVTIMVYMCGTDLESRGSMATKDLIEMTKAKLSDNLHILVYTGGCTKWNNQVVSPRVNQIYEIVDGGLQCVDQDAGKAAMTKPETLTEFIKWCTKHYPANRNELIFWDHGGGSVSGFGYDQKFPKSGSMSLAGINKALKGAGVTFDFIGFDACLMATVETGLMLDQYADYMIASEETEPGIGWYYTNWLTSFAADTSMPTVEIGKNIVDDFVTTCNASCRGQSATLSVIDLAELSNTAPAPLNQFSRSMRNMITNKQYSKVSTARNGTREFARSSAIDQIDLVHFARNMGSEEGELLADALLGAVKYNRTSADMSNSYGVSIYFPYRKTKNVDAAVNTYNAIGMDKSYSDCIRAFASLEVSGQAATGGTTSAVPSLLGTLSGQSGGSEMIGSLLGGFLGGNFGSVQGLTGANTGFLSGRALSEKDTVAYIEDNSFDTSLLKWKENEDGQKVISLPEEQWELVTGLDQNLFYDDGEGYVDLGLDNVFEFDDEGNLLASADGTWLAVDGQPVAYYHEFTQGEGDSAVISGYIPAMLNDERVELLVMFDHSNPRGTITGARRVYKRGETETVAKSMVTLERGDKLDFICDFYSYDGAYEDSYLLGDPVTVTGNNLNLSNVSVGEGATRVTYRFTDIYQQHYWTPAIKQ